MRLLILSFRRPASWSMVIEPVRSRMVTAPRTRSVICIALRMCRFLCPKKLKAGGRETPYLARPRRSGRAPYRPDEDGGPAEPARLAGVHVVSHERQRQRLDGVTTFASVSITLP